MFSPPSHGSLSGTPPNLVYTPVLYYVGADSFTFAANDGHTNSTPGTVSIQLTRINHAPLTSNQFLNIPENTAASITLTAVDLEGNPITYSIPQPPSHGTLSGTAPNLSYLPNTNFLGNDSFGFAVADNHGNTNTGTVSFTVLNFNLTTVSNTLWIMVRAVLRQAIATAQFHFQAPLHVNIGFAANLAGQTVSLTNAAPDVFGPSALVVSNQIVINGQAASGVGISRNLSAAYMRLFHVTPSGQLTLSHLTVSSKASCLAQKGAPGVVVAAVVLVSAGPSIMKVSSRSAIPLFPIILLLAARGEEATRVRTPAAMVVVLLPGAAEASLEISDNRRDLAVAAAGRGSTVALAWVAKADLAVVMVAGLLRAKAMAARAASAEEVAVVRTPTAEVDWARVASIFNNGGVVQIVNSAIIDGIADAGLVPQSSIAQPGQGLGDAIFNRNGSVTIYNSSMTNNGRSDLGGGVYNLGDGSQSTVTMEGINFGFFQGTNVVDASVGGGVCRLDSAFAACMPRFSAASRQRSTF